MTRLFTPDEAAVLQEVILHRRDVRGNRFVGRPLEEAVIEQLLTAALHAPPVGFSQPWEFVVIRDKNVRQQVKDSFDVANASAAASFGAKEETYARLRLEGILDAPVNIAVFYKPSEGGVLGQTSMGEMGFDS